MGKLGESTFCRDHDLVGPITLLIATGLRRSEMLVLRWVEYDDDACTVVVTGKVVRVKGEACCAWMRPSRQRAGGQCLCMGSRSTCSTSAATALSRSAADDLPIDGGTWRDPNNFSKEWRDARQELGIPEITVHSFRKTVATLIDDAGPSARIGSDHLGHTHVCMTQDRYMARGRVHTQVTHLLDRAVRIDDQRGTQVGDAEETAST